MIETRGLAELLGVKPKNGTVGTLDLADAVGKGLPVRALDRLSAAVAPGDTGMRYRIVPKATLMRRAARGRLSAEESDRVARLARVWAFALDVWGSSEAARGFLTGPHPLLRGREAWELAIESEIGAHAVEQLLGRLKYGSAV